jgi:hypothetical protein
MTSPVEVGESKHGMSCSNSAFSSVTLSQSVAAMWSREGEASNGQYSAQCVALAGLLQ